MRSSSQISNIFLVIATPVMLLLLSAAVSSQSNTDSGAEATDDAAIPFALPEAGPFNPSEIKVENSQAIADWFRSAHADAAAEAFHH